MTNVLLSGLTILVLAFIQNVSFSIVSRSRNRDNIAYHIYASTASNLIWFLTFKQLIIADMSWWLLPSYVLGTVCGSVFGVKVSMKIETWLGATSDGHIKKEVGFPKQPKEGEQYTFQNIKYTYHKGVWIIKD